MTHAFIQDVPIDAAFYQRIKDALGDDPPKGLLVHLAMERSEGGLRYIDVWESQEDSERFTEERLHPVMVPMLREIFGDQLPPEPEKTPVSMIDVWCP